MTIASGSTVLASDIQAIKDDVDAVISASGAFVEAAESTSSTSFTDLTTAGPAVTLTTGTTVLVLIRARLENSTAGNSAIMSYAVSGDSTVSASIQRSIQYESSGASDRAMFGSWVLVSGLTAGSNTFTAKYEVDGGTGTFGYRSIAVIPLGV